ncbi:MAG TPA: transglycosylase family protein, partial [Egibacteraceae bacterium]|nr:transglycosylase family protein [Egibacteraceae bacterium]
MPAASPGRRRRYRVLLALVALAGCSPLLLGHHQPVTVAVEPRPPQLPVAAAPAPRKVGGTASRDRAAAAAQWRFHPVAVLAPRVRVDGVAEGLLGAALAVPGVAFATEVTIGDLESQPPGVPPSALRVAAVDPAGFRVLSPQVTADAPPLWERLVAGDAVVTHEVAQRSGLVLGAEVAVGPARRPLRVGALATNGTPPVADAVVDRKTARRLGLEGARTLLVALAPEADPARVARALSRRLGAAAAVIEDPRRPHPVRLTGRLNSDNVWDYLALCESGGNWHINTGNGYYGGLQFLPESWYLVGGTGLPHEATREEQIHRARLLLAIQGWRAWPVCSVLLGLRPPDPPSARA